MCGWHLHLYKGCSIFVYNLHNCICMHTIVWYLYVSMISERGFGNYKRWTALLFSRRWPCKASLQHSHREQCQSKFYSHIRIIRSQWPLKDDNRADRHILSSSKWGDIWLCSLLDKPHFLYSLIHFRRFTGGDETNSFPVSGPEVNYCYCPIIIY